jgi:hypothetical protein
MAGSSSKEKKYNEILFRNTNSYTQQVLPYS